MVPGTPPSARGSVCAGARWVRLDLHGRAPGAVVTAGLAGLLFGIAITIKPTLLALSLFYLPLAGSLRSRRRTSKCVGRAGGRASARRDHRGRLLGCWPIHGDVRGVRGLPRRLHGTPPWRRAPHCILVVQTDELGPKCGRATHRLHAVRHLGPGSRHATVPCCSWHTSALPTHVFVQGTFAGYHYLPGLAIGAVFVGTMVESATGWVRTR